MLRTESTIYPAVQELHVKEDVVDEKLQLKQFDGQA